MMKISNMQLRQMNPFSVAAKSHRAVRLCTPSRGAHVVNAKYSGTPGMPFNESASQVKRLINRDRKEFMGNEKGLLDKLETEFGDGQTAADQKAPADEAAGSAALSTPAASPSSSTPSTSSFGMPNTPTISASTANPFKSASASPFGKPAAPKPFKSSIEPKGMSPDMGPDPIVKETPVDFIKNINLTQIVIVISFTLIIALMVSTFTFVFKVGGIRLAGLD